MDSRYKPGTLLYWINWARTRTGIKASAKSVLNALAARAQPETGECFPAVRLLMSDTGLGERTVRDALKQLEHAGLVASERRYRGAGTDGGQSSSIRRLIAKPEEAVAAHPAGNHDAHSAPDAVTRGGLPANLAAIPLQDSQGPPAGSAPQEETIDITNRRGNVHSLQNEHVHALNKATQEQISYLQDLYIHKHREIPNDEELDAWSKLTISQASTKIKHYLKDIGVHSNYEGPEEGTTEYEALSPSGKIAADHTMLPEWRDYLAVREVAGHYE